MSKQAKSRKCLMCRNDFDKEELLRFVITPDNQLMYDVYAKAPARGMYICSDDKCLDKALNKKVLFKINKLEMPENFLQTMQLGLLNQIQSYFLMLKKANMVVLGSDFVLDLIKNNKASFISLATDISEKSKIKIETLAVKNNVACNQVLTKQKLEDITDVANCSVAGFKACKLSKSLEKSLNIYKSLKKYEK